jgi:hypothetical protein
MSFTNADFFTAVLQDVGILTESDRSPNAEQGIKGLMLMNDMMFEWESQGIDLQYSEQHSTTDDCPIDVRDRQVIRANLAVRWVDMYGGTLKPVTASLASTGYDRLCRDAVLATQIEKKLDNMPHADDRSLHFGNILTGNTGNT